MIRIGIIGCGKIAQVRHLPEYAANPNAEIVAYYDKNRARAEEMAAKYDDFQIVKVNVDECRDLALRYGIQVIPTLLVLMGGQVVNRAAGLMGEPEILALVRG